MKKIALLALYCSHLCANDLTWSTPQVLSTIGENAVDPRIAMDPQGNLVAAWIENDVVMSNTQLYRGSWNDFPRQVSDVGATSLELAVDKKAMRQLSGISMASSNQPLYLFQETGAILRDYQAMQAIPRLAKSPLLLKFPSILQGIS